ncbi:MAG: TIR domain-containing protein [Planctomycetes bacterium]|nr:TIR domain-containing protein [Planctomycetota bacterium]
MMEKNPYSPGMGLPDPRTFVGRRQELERALGLLGADSPRSIEIVGASRIGKTTLLDRVAAGLSGRGADRAPWCIVLGPLHAVGRATMFRQIVEAVRSAVPDAPPAGDAAYAPDGFAGWLERALRGHPAVIFLDDFDDSYWPDEESRFEAYGVLRAAVWRRALGLCLSLRRPLEAICREGGRSRSLLWNIFTAIPLGLLEPGEARELIERPHAEAGLPVEDREWDVVFRVAGTHPFLMQIAGFRLFDEKRRAGGGLSNEALYHLEEGLEGDARRFFSSFVRGVGEEEERLPAALRALAEHRPGADPDVDALVRLGVAYRTPAGPRLLSEAFERFVLSGDRGAARGGPAVFVCHAHEDREFTERLCRDLDRAGVRVWLDWIDIPPGHMFERAIDKALSACTHVVLIVTDDALESDWVRSEVEFALSKRKVVIPVRRDLSAELPPRWHALQALDATTEKKYEAAIERLAALLPGRS